MLIGEQNEHFDQEFLKPFVALERVVIKSVNGEDCTVELQEVKESFIGEDFDIP